MHKSRLFVNGKLVEIVESDDLDDHQEAMKELLAATESNFLEMTLAADGETTEAWIGTPAPPDRKVDLRAKKPPPRN